MLRSQSLLITNFGPSLLIMQRLVGIPLSLFIIQALPTLRLYMIKHFKKFSATAVRFATSTLEKYGLYGVTPEEFLQLARNDLHLEQDLQVYADIATDLVSFAEQLSSYRANNRSGGLQWQGGGFGLSGAIKGTLMAGKRQMKWQ